MNRFALLALVAACGDSSPSPDAEPARQEVATIAVTPATKLDLLFLMDNSPADDLALNFRTQIPALVTALGDVPDYHIGVATSDLGATGANSPTPGPSVGAAGQRGACVDVGDDGMLVPQDGTNVPYLTNANTTDLATSLAALVREPGINGCAFEQHLRGAVRALTNPANGDFRRPDAALALVVVADEDDCSVLDPAFFTPDTTTLGPLQSFRCTQFGVTCDQPITDIGQKTNCKPDDASVWIQSPNVSAAALRALQPNPGKLAVAIFAGPAQPVAVELVAPSVGQPPLPSLTASCMSQGVDSVTAEDPAVRLAALAASFGSHGSAPDTCVDDRNVPAQAVAATIRTALGVSCVSASLTTAQCVADDGQTSVPACNGATTDCFDFVTDAACPGALRAIVNGGSLPSDAAVTIRCTSGL